MLKFKIKSRKKSNPIAEKPNNCLIYVRVSTEEQAKKGYSLDKQEADNIKFAQSIDINTIKVFREEGESAKTLKRSKLQELIKFCERNKKEIKYLIVWKLDRLSRSNDDMVELKKIFKRLNIEILSATESNEKNAAGKLQRNMMSAMAQYENDVKSERAISCMQQAFKFGRWLWRAPFGYIQDKNIRNIVPDKEKSLIVKNIFEKLAFGCYSQIDILADLSKQGIKMNANHLCRILRNPLYCGYMLKEDWSSEPVKGTFKPIITENIFGIVQNILDGRKPSVAPHDLANPDYPLKQFLLCPYCGKPLTGSTSTGRNKKKFYYYACYNKQCQNKFSMSKSIVEKGFVEHLSYLKPKEELINLFEMIVKDNYKESVSELRTLNIKLQRQLDNIKESKNKLVDFYLNNKIDEDTYNSNLGRFSEQEREVKSKIQNVYLSDEDFEDCLKFSINVIQNLDKAWQNSILRIKKSIQKLIFPQGLRADFQDFQNSVNSTIFNKIDALSASYIDNIPPREFESLSTP